MIEPMISRYEDFDTKAMILRLTIPYEWLVEKRFPRARITLWLLKLLWRGWNPKRNPE